MRLAIAVLVCFGISHPSWAQSGENVAVVINDNSTQSQTIGEYYASKRGIPAVNLFHIRTSLDEQIDRATFNRSIEWPLRTMISARGLQDRVLYIVLTKDVPLRIVGSTDQFWTAASVDSELTLLYRRMTGGYVPLIGYVDNPYFVGRGDVGSAKPFTHRDQDIVLVSRLDGASVGDVLGLIDRAATPSVDDVPQLRSGAATAPVTASDNVPTRFAAGSIAATTRAYRATSFREASQTSAARSLARHPRSGAVEVADLIHQGAIAAAGETRPDLPGNPTHLDILFPAYLRGANAVESFYLAIPYLSANTIIIGDPLSAPFRQRTLTRSDIEAGEDPDSSLPRFFSERLVASMRAVLPYVPVPALALTLRATQHLARGERHQARVLLEQVTTNVPEFASAQFNLGMIYQTEGEYERSMECYRLAIEAQRPPAREELVEIFGRASPLSARVAALNNLAYLIAVQRHAPAEALSLARKAVAAAPLDPSILDTLAWIEYLLGDSTNAMTHVRVALAKEPSATIRLHAAAIFAAAGMRAEAETQLNEALRLEPSLEKSVDAIEARSRLHGESACTNTADLALNSEPAADVCPISRQPAVDPKHTTQSADVSEQASTR